MFEGTGIWDDEARKGRRGAVPAQV